MALLGQNDGLMTQPDPFLREGFGQSLKFFEAVMVLDKHRSSSWCDSDAQSILPNRHNPWNRRREFSGLGISCLAGPATDHDEGSPRVLISGLNRTAFDLAVYASQGWSPTHHARLASGCWSGSTGRDWLPAGFHLKGFKLPTILLSRAFLRKVRPSFKLT